MTNAHFSCDPDLQGLNGAEHVSVLPFIIHHNSYGGSSEKFIGHFKKLLYF